MLTARSRTRAFEPVLTMTAVISDFLSDCFFCIRAEELTTIVNKEAGTGEGGGNVRVRSGLLHNLRSWVDGIWNECTIDFGNRF